MTAKKRRYAAGFFLGLALVWAAVWLLCHYYYYGTLYNARVALIGPEDFQSANVDLLKAERDKYVNALKGDVCSQPAMEGEDPFFTLLGEPAAPGDARLAVASRQKEALSEVIEGLALIRAKGVRADGQAFERIGAGFFVNRDTIMTNRRIVDGLGPAGSIVAASGALRQVMPAVVLAVSEPESLRDYALLKVKPDAGPPPRALKIVAEGAVADRVMAFGYPDGDYAPDSFPDPVYAMGAIGYVLTDVGSPLIGHTAETTRRYRGGPIIDRLGRVIGLETTVFLDKSPSSRRLRLALGGSDVLAFLEENYVRVD
ncbi:MAG: serine protease [Deltaproteobacteria bacterium]|nr:serine protease [Deltaproteobacteria bacterium]